LVIAAQTEESDTARNQLKAEVDVDAVRTRASRDQERLDAGRVSSPKELEQLQHEISSLRKRQSELEDAVLAVMEHREEIQGRLAELLADRDRAQAELDHASYQRDVQYAEIDAEVTGLHKQRAALIAGLLPDLLALYEKLRAQHDGIGAAALRGGRCEGCRLQLDARDLSRIRSAAADAVLRCEECRRILVRTPESGL